MHDGSVFGHPMWVRPTDGSGSSSSLNVPTPTASDAVWSDKGYTRRGIVGNHNLSLVDWLKFLPTPSARDMKGKGSQGTRADGRTWSDGMTNLPNVIEKRSHGDPTPPRSDDGSR